MKGVYRPKHSIKIKTAQFRFYFDTVDVSGTYEHNFYFDGPDKWDITFPELESVTFDDETSPPQVKSTNFNLENHDGMYTSDYNFTQDKDGFTLHSTNRQFIPTTDYTYSSDSSLAALSGFLTKGATFSDVIHDGYSDTQWYKIWDEKSGQYFTQGASETSGNWVSPASLSQMELPYDVNKFYITAWGPETGQSEWVDFVVSIGETNSTVVLEDQDLDAYTTLSYDQIINTSSLDSDAYLRVYNPAKYLYLDVSGDGWLKADELSNYLFEAGAAGETMQLWINTYLHGSGQSGWENFKIKVK